MFSQYVCLCSISQGEKAAVQRWLPHVPAPSRGNDPQSGSQRGVPGHEPAPQSLLHLLLTQHLSDEGSAQRAQQHGGLCQVKGGPVQSGFGFPACKPLIRSLQSAERHLRVTQCSLCDTFGRNVLFTRTTSISCTGHDDTVKHVHVKKSRETSFTV